MLGKSKEGYDYYNETIASSQYTGDLLIGLSSGEAKKHTAEFKFEAGNTTGKGISHVLCLTLPTEQTIQWGLRDFFNLQIPAKKTCPRLRENVTGHS